MITQPLFWEKSQFQPYCRNHRCLQLFHYIHPSSSNWDRPPFPGWEAELWTLGKCHVHFSVQFSKSKVRPHQNVHANWVWRWSVVRACKACTLTLGLEHSGVLRRVFSQVCLSPEAGSKAERVPADQTKTDESCSPASLLTVAFSIYMQHACLHAEVRLYSMCRKLFQHSTTWQPWATKELTPWLQPPLYSSPSKADWPYGPENNTHTHRAGEDWRVHTCTCACASPHSHRSTYEPVALLAHRIDLRCKYAITVWINICIKRVRQRELAWKKINVKTNKNQKRPSILRRAGTQNHHFFS